MTIRMLKPIKKVYFWIKSKVNKMINASNLAGLKEEVNTMVDDITSQINQQVNIGYVFLIQKTDEYIDFKIGEDKFSVYWFLDVPDYLIYLKTYYWEFDPNVIGNRKKILLDQFYIIISPDWIKFTGHQNKFDGVNKKNVYSFYLHGLKEYISGIHKQEVQKIENGNNILYA